MKNKKLVLDSCVFNKLFLDEPDRHLAVDLIKNSQGVKFIVPSIFLYEVMATALTYKLNAEKIYTLLEQQRLGNLQLIDMTFELLKKAAEICAEGNNKSGFPSFYDSAYHALAIINDCDFITSDKKHYEKTKKFGHIKLLSQVK
jgi:predicted nucleic acid-binding protein